MLDLSYVPDTEVVDVDDADRHPYQGIARPRVPTKELDVHVWLDDGWHRLDAAGGETACGVEVDPRIQIGTRMGREIKHPLAGCECWTKRERAKADDNYRREYGRDYEP